MAIIYMDESGDLGFDFRKLGTSKFFLITFLFCANHRQIEKCVRKVHRLLRKKERKTNVLHANKERPVTRKRLLECLARQHIAFMTIQLNKKKVYTTLQNEKQVLYNYVTNILIDRIISRQILPLGSLTTIIASRRETNRFLNENFKSYLKEQTVSNYQVSLDITIRTPNQEKGLQAVDFASWAIFRKLEHNDIRYYNIIKQKIVEENWLFP